MRTFLRACACTFLLTIAVSAPTNAARVTQIQTIHKDGQTFITWTKPAGSDYRYRVYASSEPIWYLSSFWSAVLIGCVRDDDSTWCDKRLSALTGTTYGRVVDASMPELTSNQVVFVVTPPVDRQVWYCVTADSAGMGEDRSFMLAANTLIGPVYEYLGRPKPVYQRTLPVRGLQAEVYTLWTSRHATDLFPAMSNRDYMPYDCAIVRGVGGTNALLVRPHARGGNFLDNVEGSGCPGEWRLALDEPGLNYDGNTFWYGWHEDYDLTSDWNQPPTTGVVRDYTMQRMLHTVLWARGEFPVDTTRVYAFGYSMGGIGSVLLAFKRPDVIAGVMAIVGKYDFGFSTDPNPMSAFNAGGSLRAVTDRMWGPIANNLPTSDGPGVYQRLNDGWLAKQQEAVGVPPIISFSGKNDVVVGWAEKIDFYRSMGQHRQGGMFFWDGRTHNSSNYCAWAPLQDVKYLYRFRTNRSYPALFNCSADFNPGGGPPTSGDSVGTINGFVEWDTTIVDQPDKWEVRLTLRDLYGNYSDYLAPDSVTVHITPRRLQQFPIVPWGLYAYTIRRSSDGAIVQHGMEQADTLGLLTLYWAKVYREGSVVTLTKVENTTDVDDGPLAGRIGLALARNPVTGPTSLSVRWPRAEAASLELTDVAGRRMRTLFHGTPHAGITNHTLETRGLAGGMYFVTARQGRDVTTRRVTLIP